jgi:hypothetical protein
MKVFIILFFSCMSVFSEDHLIHVHTLLRTNDNGCVITKDVFIHNSQTNLMCYTSTKSGAMQTQIHSFFYHGTYVGMFVKSTSSITYSEPNCPYSLDFVFSLTNNVKTAFISSEDGHVLDAFIATNDAFYPADSILIKKANDQKMAVLALRISRNFAALQINPQANSYHDSSD